ncbi:tRNA lysidine(34) synthetase TilS [Paralimibaculum aggregatum]|uniref:tRNA(Ile)-lysidine synthase n=1 Tax=Paralimibaculum aggregatum TaxID=3036245 RepID=A0ABQ6LQR0_9RHOB|nr:tRNA lysidine(34) synthetase TilS [Limibaculum sp. NKW23]GMG83339.1 tRNA lysidine(34) synthetase TilS [Limibaculum sp. NKW23]
MDRLAPPAPAGLGIALSGGGDSAALTVLAADWARGSGHRLAAATVDHGLRPESGAEAAAAGRLAATLGISHTVLRWDDAPGRGNLQAAARAARQRLLGAWAAREGLAAVLTGHTLEDRAETLLLRLARGSGLDGLAALAPAAEVAGTRWLRPCLGLRREALRDLLRARGIGWAEDPSNDDPRFERVRARQALALLAPLGIGAEGLAATAARLGEQRLVLEDAAAALALEARRLGPLGEVVHDGARLAAARADTAFRVLADSLCGIGGAAYRPRQEALERILTALPGPAEGTLAGCCWRADGDSLTIWREAAAAAAPVALVSGAVWDGRWRAEAAGPPGTMLGPLGAPGLAALRAAERSGEWTAPVPFRAAPVALRRVQPALWGAPGLLAAPTAGYTAPDHGGAGPAIADLLAQGCRRAQGLPFRRSACP